MFAVVCYAIKTNSRTIRSQVTQPASAGKGADMSELQAHHCMTPDQWTWLSWGTKWTVIRRITSVNCWLSILRNFWFFVPISGGANARFDPPAGANVSHIEFRLVRATLLIQKLVWPTVFRSTLNKMIMHKTPSFYYNPFINIFQKWDMFHLKNEGLRHNKIMESCCSSRNPYQHIAWDESPVWKFRIPSAREHCILPRGIRNVGS